MEVYMRKGNHPETQFCAPQYKVLPPWIYTDRGLDSDF